MSGFQFTTVSRMICEPGAAGSLAEVLSGLGVSRPLMVTDKGIVAAGLLAPVAEALSRHSDVAVFDAVIADPPESVINAAVAAAKAHSADGIVGLGGGSSLDTAKVIARLACEQAPSDQQSLSDLYGVDVVRGKRLPLVLIPTTAGTGSEATPVAVVTTGNTTKAGIVSPLLLPDVAVLDAALTTGMPVPVTAATGIDAMVHAIEAITSKIKRNPYSHTLAMKALALLSQNIEAACSDPTNLDAREAMLLGAFMAGQAFANAPVAGVHALAYPLGGHFHIPHGLSNALVLPHVLRYNVQAAASDYAAIADCIIPGQGTSDNDKSEALADYFYQLSGRLGLPQTLSACDVPASALETLASDAMLQTRLLVNNPVEIDYDAALAIYQRAL